MPVCINSNEFIDDRWTGAKWPYIKPAKLAHARSNRSISIGLVNNMPDGALAAAERQFLSLLDSASGSLDVRVSFYSLHGIPRGESGVRYINNFYSSTDNLWNTHLDGLIVTGREPLASNLADEPYWNSFTRVLEWARYNTYSAVWSCLAAHAAILHMNGIRRVKSPCKHSGVFECMRVAEHPLTARAPRLLKLPHSRWNGIGEDALVNSGYSVLTSTADIGVDTFIKQERSLFVFFQGHPEYESDTLLLEYRRDVGRYLRGETDAYPLIPNGYFDQKTAAELTVLQKRAISHKRADLLEEVTAALGKSSIENTWHSAAICIYRNWLEYICAQKQQLKSRSLSYQSSLDAVCLPQ
jgi:homoserine O-succinyltransferase